MRRKAYFNQAKAAASLNGGSGGQAEGGGDATTPVQECESEPVREPDQKRRKLSSPGRDTHTAGTTGADGDDHVDGSGDSHGAGGDSKGQTFMLTANHATVMGETMPGD